MKIGIFDPYFDDLGGGEKYMMKIAQCLSENHDINIFWDKKEDLEELKKRFLLDLSKIKLSKNIFSKKTPLITRLLESRKYDAIIFLSDGSIPFLLSKKTFIHLQQPIPSAKKTFKNKIKIGRINKFFCNSYYSKSYVDKSLGVNSVVLYPPVEIKKKSLEKENIILHVGRFRVRNVGVDDYKKQNFMVGVFQRMINEGLKNWKFVLVVSVKDEEKKIFDNFINKTRNFPIEFLINKNNDELWDIYSRAKIYWHATGYGEDLKRHPEYAEHFGISTVEAMGAGDVPIVINAGGQKEIVEDRKSGFLWDRLDELVDNTNLLIRNEELLKKMSKEAKKRARIFNGDRFCNEVSELINS